MKTMKVSSSLLFTFLLFPSAAPFAVDCVDFCSVYLGINEVATKKDAPPVVKGESANSGGNLHTQYSAFCTFDTCVVAPAWYDKFKPPKPWRPEYHNKSQINPICAMSGTEEATLVNVLLPEEITRLVSDDPEGTLEFNGAWSLQWHDPRLNLCVCGAMDPTADGQSMYLFSIEDDGDVSRYIMGSSLEHFIWTPDLHIQQGDGFDRRLSTTGALLNDITVAQEPGCPLQINLQFDGSFGVNCMMNMDWYPFDKNICHVKVGSLNFPATDLVYFSDNGARGVSAEQFHDFKIYYRPLNHQLKNEIVRDPNPKKRPRLHMFDGFSIIVERNPMYVLRTHLPIIWGISFFVSIQYILGVTEPGRVALLSASIFTMFLALEGVVGTTPEPSNQYNYITTFAYWNVLIVLASFFQHCVILSVATVFPNSRPVLAIIDLVCFFIHLSLFITMNWWYWFHNPYFPGPEICHNDDNFFINCDT